MLPLQVNPDSGGCNVMMFYLPNFSARNAAGGGEITEMTIER